MTELLKPALYEEDGTANAPNHPAMLGGQCVCGYVFFPMQTYGCERCGRHGDDLTTRRLSGRGTLVACATVHLHGGDRLNMTAAIEAPFVIGSVQLEDGPVVRGLVVGGDDASLLPGHPMVTALALTTTPEGEPRLDLRFAPQGGALSADAPAGEAASSGDDPEFHSF